MERLIERLIAISYSRFSDPTQGDGDSEDRQWKMFLSFCERHNLVPAKDHFIDRGLSGFTGKHRDKGDLGRLIGLLKDNPGFAKGKILVVEAWDRLGRLVPNKQIRLIEELLETGLKIGICRLNDIFEIADFGTPKWMMLAAFVQMAYEESRQKSERVRAAWKSKRIKAREKGSIVTGRLPAWLTVVNGVMQPLPDRVAVVKRIFKMAADGFGLFKISRILNGKLDGKGKPTAPVAPAFGKRKVGKKGGPSGKWTRAYLDLLLHDKRVLGVYQPRLKDGTTEPPIPNYYPRIVSEDEFALASQGVGQRTTKKGPRQRKYINIFAGLLRNAASGDGFALHNKGTSDKPRLLLLPASINNGAGGSVSIPYSLFERGILSQLREIKASELEPQGEGPNPLDVLETRLKNVAEDIAGLKDDLRKKYSRAITQVLGEKEDEESRLTEEWDRLKAEQINPASEEWRKLPNLADALEQAEDQEDARIRLRAVLRRTISSIQVLVVPRGRERLAAVQVHFCKDGKRRDYLLYFKPVIGRTPSASTWCRSLATIHTGADLDLRRRVDAEALELDLLTLDVEWLAEQLGGG
jgi:DNA invertase Pin-like site-specific DNA recombinase